MTGDELHDGAEREPVNSDGTIDGRYQNTIRVQFIAYKSETRQVCLEVQTIAFEVSIREPSVSPD